MDTHMIMYIPSDGGFLFLYLCAHVLVCMNLNVHVWQLRLTKKKKRKKLSVPVTCISTFSVKSNGSLQGERAELGALLLQQHIRQDYCLQPLLK